MLKIRQAEEKDIELIFAFICELAEYEKMLNEVSATPAILKEWLFDKKAAEVIFVMEDNIEVGYALFFHNFSTFTGKAGLYLEDIYVKPTYRKKGFGKALFKELVKIAYQRGCSRMEWVCLDWNKPSIDFYLSVKAKPIKDWTIFRLDHEEIKDLANS
ncbi:MAG: GNAT family N-acetyltransferase [Erysipelotrichaceae bacterium]|nr:GNAT family N-acetyltransferase [Erysipelotrichaceae bacterium]MDD4643135.1 GNAT family N-acetyltransferase [Erysipelotrichaceae bacterium]